MVDDLHARYAQTVFTFWTTFVGRMPWTELFGSGYGQVVGCCACGNEPSGSINCMEFLY